MVGEHRLMDGLDDVHGVEVAHGDDPEKQKYRSDATPPTSTASAPVKQRPKAPKQPWQRQQQQLKESNLANNSCNVSDKNHSGSSVIVHLLDSWSSIVVNDRGSYGVFVARLWCARGALAVRL